MPPVDRAPVLLALLVAAPAVPATAAPSALPSGSTVFSAAPTHPLPSSGPTVVPATAVPSILPPVPVASPAAPTSSTLPSDSTDFPSATPPALPTAFSTNVTPRDRLPDPAIVGHDETLPLLVTVGGPGGLVPPDEVHLDGTDDQGTPLRFSPNPVPLEPGRHRYPVEATYTAPSTGEAHLTVTAHGPLRARGNWSTTLPVGLDPVTVTVADVGETAPDWEVPLALEANTTRLPAEAATLVPRVRSAGDEPATAWNATATPANLTGEPTTVDASFAARYGPGRYQVQVEARGNRSAGASAPVLVDVEEPPDPSDDAPVEAIVPDRPATLDLTSDSVNDDGKAKYPGQTVITRLVARDPNGLQPDAVDVTVHREHPDGSRVPVRNASLPLPEDAWARKEVHLEDRFAWAPLKDAPYVLEARLPGTEADPATRTFRILDEQATLADGTVPDDVATHPPPVLDGHAVVADDNLGGGPDGPPVAELETLSARLYRYSQELDPPAEVTFPGNRTALDLSETPSHPDNYGYATEGDAGRFRIPVDVHLPPDPEPGTYHVTLEHRRPPGTRDLGAIFFDLGPAPRVATLEAGPARPGQPLAVDGSLEDADGVHGIHLALRDPAPDGAPRVLAEANATGFPAEVPVPEGLPAGQDLRLRATPLLEDGRRGSPATVTIPVAPTPPDLRAALAIEGTPAPRDPLRLVPGTAASLEAILDSRGHHGTPPNVSARLLDWNGDVRHRADCPDPDGPPRGLDCTLPLPPDLPVGRYTLQARASDAGGTATWNRTLEAGPWLDVGVAGPLVLQPTDQDVLAGSVPLRNDGNVPARRLEVRLDPLQGPGNATWTPSTPAVSTLDASLQTRPIPGGAVLSSPDGPALGPGEDTRVRVSVPLPTAVPPGNYSGSVTVATILEVPP